MFANHFPTDAANGLLVSVDNLWRQASFRMGMSGPQPHYLVSCSNNVGIVVALQK